MGGYAVDSDGVIKETGRVWFRSDAYEFVCPTGRPAETEGLFDIRSVPGSIEGDVK